MNKFLIILLHTYMSKLKSKSFIISTLVTTVLILGLSNIQSIIDIFDKEEEKVIGLLAEDREMVQRLEQQQSLVPNNLLQIEKVQSEAEAEEK